MALSLDGLWRAEVRDTPGVVVNTGAGEVPASELWLVNLRTKNAERLLEGKEDPDEKKTLARFSSPCFSLEDRAVFFVSAAWATSGSVQKLDIKSRRLQFLIDGDEVSVVLRGPNQGSLLVERSLIRHDKNGASLGRGRYIWLVTPFGKPVREIGLAESKAVATFRRKYIDKVPPQAEEEPILA